MKVLIFSMTCGEGHNMIAKSLENAFAKLGCQVKVSQTYGYDLKRVEKENKTFLWACKRIPKLYDVVWNYNRTHVKPTDKLPWYVKNCLPHFTKEIADFSPDVIVCTHFYASSVLSYMKKQKLVDEKVLTSTILTDFCVHPYWEHSTGVDIVFQPMDNTTDDLVARGFDKSQIVTCGLPIRQEFFLPFDKREAKQKLGFGNQKIVLIVGGGNGLGNTPKLLKYLLKQKADCRFVVINGKNKKSFDKINEFVAKNKIDNVTNLGFVSNMIDYMRASDVAVTRCGSSCLTECMTLGIPIVMREKMILNEKLNKQLFVNLGCGLGMDKMSQAWDRVSCLLNDSKTYDQTVQNVKNANAGGSAEKIVQYLLDKAK